MKLMYKEDGGFHYFGDAENPAGWVDGEPIRKALMDAKNPPESRQTSATIPPIAKPEEVVTIQPVAPQDTKRRPGRPFKNK